MNVAAFCLNFFTNHYLFIINNPVIDTTILRSNLYFKTHDQAALALMNTLGPLAVSL